MVEAEPRSCSRLTDTVALALLTGFEHSFGVFVEMTKLLDGSGFHSCFKVPIAYFTGTVPDVVSKLRSTVGFLKRDRGEPFGVAKLGHVVALAVDQPLSGHDLAIYAVKRMVASV